MPQVGDLVRIELIDKNVMWYGTNWLLYGDPFTD